ERWLGGTLTNFRTIRSRLQRLEELEAMQENGSLESESKKQASRLKREMRKIKTNLEGIRKMSRLPGVLVAIDADNEYIALCEAKKLGIFTIAVIDTNSDPDTVDIAIPANDDSIRAIELILSELTDAVAFGKTMVSSVEETPKPKRPRSRRAVLARAEEPQQQTVAVETSENENSTPNQTQEQNTQ
ncbi:MAG: 30S ribosomal protein S2, partial [Planctomycetota bacterium]